MIKQRFFYILFVIVLASCGGSVKPPAPYGPLPTEAQLKWHETEYYAFFHFSMNTFTDMEWGDGSEKPSTFNPTEMDVNQWMKVCKAAGMKGIIITAKHHDGFCLWPTKTTEHSVKNSPWKNGKGDLVKDLSEACKKHGLKFGVYLSPWDRNCAHYGTPKYLDIFKEQLKELLTNYGEIFEVWFDGANGGTGYYGGANENRKVDRKTYYNWPEINKIVYKYQPNTIIFSDGGPGCRWVGNEEGYAHKTNWCLLNRDEVWPGWPHYKQLRSGHENGTHWVPAEVNTSIRPGWYYHASEDHKVKSLPHLLDTYYHSIGRNGTFLLNFPPDRRGLIHENDVEHVLQLAKAVKEDFKHDLSREAKITASSTRGQSSKYGAENTIDDDKDTYWATDDGVNSGWLELDFGKPTEFNRFLAQEYIRLGQRVQKFSLEAFVDGKWKTIASETTIGYKRILRFNRVTATKLRINIEKSKALPIISNIGVYNAPLVLVEPKVVRNKTGQVTISYPEKDIDVFYTTDGTVPTKNSNKYSAPFTLKGKAKFNAVAIDAKSGVKSPVSVTEFDICSEKWSVIVPKNSKQSDKMFDGNINTTYHIKGSDEVVIDLGENVNIAGFKYTPDQARWSRGIIFNYEFYVSTTPNRWGKPISSGEFSNIKNNPLTQTKTFEKVKARYLKLKSKSLAAGEGTPSIAEFSIITK